MVTWFIPPITSMNDKYHQLKLLAILEENSRNGVAPSDVYEVVYNTETTRLEIHYTFTDNGVLLIDDFEYFHDFLMVLNYSHFEINEKEAKAYWTNASNEQLAYEIYSHITGILLTGFLIGLGIRMLYIFTTKKKPSIYYKGNSD